MNASALSYKFLYEEENKSVKKIESISIILKAIDPFPFLFRYIITLYLSFNLYILNKKLGRAAVKIKQTIKQMPYEQARDGYALLSKSNKLLSSLVSDTEITSNKQLSNGIKLLKEIQETYSSVLYYKVDPSIRLTEKEISIFAELEDIWGDDTDEVYARSTHRHLTEE